MPVVNHGIELSYTNGTDWKLLYDTSPDEIFVVTWGPVRKLTKRVLYWADAPYAGAAQNTIVYCSRDGGATIYSQKTLLSGSVYAVGCSKLTPSVAYYGDSAGKVWKTTDYGKTWTDVTPPATIMYAKCIAVSNDGTSVCVACSSNSGFLYSTDSGANWSSYAPASQREALGCVITPSGTIFGCGSYVTTGWGPTVWNVTAGSIVFEGTHGPGGYNPLSLASIDFALLGNTRAFAAHYPSEPGGLVLSKTKATSFTDISNEIFAVPGYTDDFTTVSLSKTGKIMYMAIESSGLYLSEDDGATWTKLFTYNSTDDYRVRGVVIADPVEEEWVWTLCGEDGNTDKTTNTKAIRFSEDKGETWDDMRSLITPANYSSFWTHFALGYDKNAQTGQLGGV